MLLPFLFKTFFCTCNSHVMWHQYYYANHMTSHVTDISHTTLVTVSSNAIHYYLRRNLLIAENKSLERSKSLSRMGVPPTPPLLLENHDCQKNVKAEVKLFKLFIEQRLRPIGVRAHEKSFHRTCLPNQCYLIIKTCLSFLSWKILLLLSSKW